ncbi:MAG TPA: hypothetical protein VFT91_11160 [Dehalococcoidia bacterium]|nr:hypothetical protein [Dehalococcoidia bacterium]
MNPRFPPRAPAALLPLAGLLLLALACSGGSKPAGTPAATATGTPAAGGAFHDYLLALILNVQPGGSLQARACFGFSGGPVPPGVQVPADGALVEAGIEGPGVAGASTATATTGQEGCADLAFSVNQPGSYTVRIVNVSHPAAQYAPAENQVPAQATLDVGADKLSSP